MSFVLQGEDIQDEYDQNIEHNKKNRQRLQRNQQKGILLVNVVSLAAFIVAVVSKRWLVVEFKG